MSCIHLRTQCKINLQIETTKILNSPDRPKPTLVSGWTSSLVPFSCDSSFASDCWMKWPRPGPSWILRPDDCQRTAARNIRDEMKFDWRERTRHDLEMTNCDIIINTNFFIFCSVDSKINSFFISCQQLQRLGGKT